MVMAVGSDFTHAHALIGALRETDGDARGQAERFAAIGPLLVGEGGGPLAGYASARHWRPDDGGRPSSMRRCAVAGREGGGRTLVFFHCAAELTRQQLQAFRNSAEAAGFADSLVITTAPAGGPGIVSLQAMDAPAIGDRVLAACAVDVRAGSPRMPL